MQLEEYFDFETHETKFGPVQRIRLRGHRISIEHVIQYFKEGFSPETICREIYPSLSLEKVYASITYYLHNKDVIEEYIRSGDEIGDKYYQEHLAQPEPDVVKRLRAAKAERQRTLMQPAPPSVASASNVAHT
jgi:uncharacterized protein (DUF433 family)